MERLAVGEEREEESSARGEGRLTGTGKKSSTRSLY